MNLNGQDLEQLRDRHCITSIDRNRNGAFEIDYQRLEQRRRTYETNFCVILFANSEPQNDYFVIPYQVLVHTLVHGNTKWLDKGGTHRGWFGTINGNASLSVDGAASEAVIGSYYRREDLLGWLINGNDLYSFNRYRQDEAASGWTQYELPSAVETESLKALQDRERISGFSHSSRPGQAEFRESLRLRYGGQCMVTGCPLFAIVEAAHIIPYNETSDHHPANGLLLRADIHALFDLHILGIHPETLTVSLHAEAKRVGYEPVHGRKLRLLSELRPSRDALAIRWKWFDEKMEIRENVGRPALA
jgi:hypothetical protein